MHLIMAALHERILLSHTGQKELELDIEFEMILMGSSIAQATCKIRGEEGKRREGMRTLGHISQEPEAQHSTKNP